MFATLVYLMVYTCARKCFRRVQSWKGGKARLYAAERKSTTVDMKQLTSFETATGSALSKRYGVISGFDNYLVEGIKSNASIDAVYGNGYLITINIFLVATDDMLSLLVMKTTCVRFANIYMYSILKDGGVIISRRHTRLPFHEQI
ncbi:hypothetical protein GN244_ATG18071 [Phytophthora infestans]|uniref:Uncharacterized protein n=1 Tax=Phytophthora infestans TaxID=4787 RepID=A0A833WE05_PHYIN|nr:hypothetical protein GN244_ATG18071 [Phytophthora infestans]KAF4133282.1 hypothetical protein GN958_ATG17535 [Phytophthora infestans]